MPAGGSSSPEVAGNLYIYLIPSIFKEERGSDREELPRGLFLRDLVSRMNDRGQRFHIFFYITPFSAMSMNGYHSIFMQASLF